jgi:hypothetical protein
MSQKTLLENQVIEEILRERATYYSLTKKNNDFWLLISPKFIFSNDIISRIKKSNFYFQNKSNILSVELKNNENFQFFASIVTTDIEFLKWLKLRIGYFEELDQIKDSDNKKFISDGICGSIDINENYNNSILLSNSTYLHPSISINKYKKSLELYFSKN